MYIFIHLQYRPFARKTPEQVDQNLERPLPLQAQVERRIPVPHRNV